MAGNSNLSSAYSSVSQMLGLPVAGPYSAGFDQLSGQYNDETEGGMADISRRGLGQSGAVPNLYTKAGSAYSQGAGQVVSSGQQAQNAQTQQILNALLGIGGAQVGQAGADINSQLQKFGAGGQLFEGAVGAPTGNSIWGPAAPGGFLSQGLWGNKNALLSKILGP